MTSPDAPSDATASLHEMVPFAGTPGIEMLSSAPSEVRGRIAWAKPLWAAR